MALTWQREDVSIGDAKRAFKVWRDWLRRAFPTVCGFWKVEPQERGTPHFHLLLHVPEGVDDQAVRLAMYRRWHRVADPEGVHHAWWHLRDDNWQRLQSWEQVIAYVAGYMGKPVDARWASPGRWWGKLNGSAIPRAPFRTIEVSRAAAVTFARLVRRYVEHCPCAWIKVEDVAGKLQLMKRSWKMSGSSLTVGEFVEGFGIAHQARRYKFRHWSSESMCRSVPAEVRDRILEYAMREHPLDDQARLERGRERLDAAFDDIGKAFEVRSRFRAAFDQARSERADRRAAVYSWRAMSPLERLTAGGVACGAGAARHTRPPGG